MLNNIITNKASFFTVALLAMVVTAPSLASAEDETWKGELGLGGVRTGGNTQIQSINATTKAGRSWGAFDVNLSGSALSSSDQGAITSEKYNAVLDLTYNVSDRFYLFQNSGFTKERFSGYKHRIIVTAGAAYKLIKTDAHTLDVLAGGGIRSSKLEGTLGTTLNEGIASGSLKYHWKISPTAAFNQTASAQYGKENTVAKFNSDLTLQIFGALAAQLGFHVTHTSKVPFVTVKKTDTESVVNLVYSF